MEKTRAQSTADLLRWEIAQTIHDIETELEFIVRLEQVYATSPSERVKLKWRRELLQRDVMFYTKQLEQMKGGDNVELYHSPTETPAVTFELESCTTVV
jgi:hypothetical protein